jgi:cytochrome c oxidase subunit 2
MKHFLIVGAIALVLSLLLGFGLAAADLTPAPSATQAGPIDAMIHLQTWLIAFLFSLISVFIIYSAVVFRKGRVAGGGEKGYGAPFKSSTRLEVAWTILPLGLVLVLSFIGAQDLAAVRQVDPQAMEVKVTAFQWGWLFDYPDSGIQSNTLYLPVDKQVHLVMTSRDVIHSFWVPEFRVKQDVLPGENLMKELRITPTEIGDYKVRCAEMCGGAHALMESPVKVVSQADYDAWVGEQSNAAAQPPEERGRRLAEAQGCVTCHSLDGTRIVGPTWKGLYGAQVPLADGGTVSADDAYLHDSIIDPNKQVHQGFPPGVMQSYQATLSDEQIKDIIEFIKTVK